MPPGIAFSASNPNTREDMPETEHSSNFDYLCEKRNIYVIEKGVVGPTVSLKLIVFFEMNHALIDFD